MDENLISKKDLLCKYGISYGALYRWKRMGLIPEDWFIKKATVTGQETFFPRELICARVETIIEKKDALSLDELAKEFVETKKDAELTIATACGEKRFALSETSQVKLILSNGSEVDLTDYIKHFLEE